MAAWPGQKLVSNLNNLKNLDGYVVCKVLFAVEEHRLASYSAAVNVVYGVLGILSLTDSVRQREKQR